MKERFDRSYEHCSTSSADMQNSLMKLHSFHRLVEHQGGLGTIDKIQA